MGLGNNLNRVGINLESSVASIDSTNDITHTILDKPTITMNPTPINHLRGAEDSQFNQTHHLMTDADEMSNNNYLKSVTAESRAKTMNTTQEMASVKHQKSPKL